ncbi:hypothetical protein [Raoultella planticola]|uniref:hypothetical protein n=1 Tax=Raoultella planticola TaxID=575 RepID=UPI000A9185C9|nr:hypothetical protein [Raoultella planticola]EKW3527821.1 hypothetical protein [Raoultella planticola]ELC3570373.1 hypothetical protein [Raoultella planticola]ELF4969838.1 hypothetical protein [Raoultella planticola]ELH7937856.1 hypothetical protein [Raoultella planticola]ELN0132104.1 hypothetical protein [Raoultella planticola]
MPVFCRAAANAWPGRQKTVNRPAPASNAFPVRAALCRAAMVLVGQAEYPVCSRISR